MLGRDVAAMTNYIQDLVTGKLSPKDIISMRRIERILCSALTKHYDLETIEYIKGEIGLETIAPYTKKRKSWPSEQKRKKGEK